jgi:hypothetical protein
MTTARRRQEIRAMSNMTVGFEPPTRSGAPAVYTPHVKFSSYDVRTGPVSTGPRATKKTSKTRKEKIYRRKLTKAEIGARARADLAKKNMLPTIEADDIVKSQVNEGSKQKSMFGQMRDSFCERAAPDHAFLDGAQEKIRTMLAFLPNVVGVPIRAVLASVPEACRLICLESVAASPEEPSLNIKEETVLEIEDRATTIEELDRSLEWGAAGTIERAASTAFDLFESQFFEANATLVDFTGVPDRDFETTITKDYQDRDITSEIRKKPFVEDPRPYWTYNDLIREIEGKFHCDGSPALHDGRSLQGRVILITYQDAAESRIRDLLGRVFRANDLLLTDAVQSEHLDDGVAFNFHSAADRMCLGVENSRCVHVRAYDSIDLWGVVAQTGPEHPGRTVYVVTDVVTTDTLRRHFRNNQRGLAMVLSPM